MKIKIAPSILSADFSDMGGAVKMLERSGADAVHCDVMDGSFVEPITFGGQMVKNLRPLTSLTLDAHLMIKHPKTQIKFFAEAGADIICVHYEACAKEGESYLKETLELIKSYGVKCGAAVNPDTDVEMLFPYFGMLDMVLVMSVFPGYGGQKFIPTALAQIKKARYYADSVGRSDLMIEVDGGVTADNAKEVRAAGADMIVAGSAVFKAADKAAAIKAIREE